jgi:hypothetical protein
MNAVGVWLNILHCQPLYFFLAAFTGLFAFVFAFLTILNIEYVLLIYKFTELDWLYLDGESTMALAYKDLD